jgi:hypothetical protein
MTSYGLVTPTVHLNGTSGKELMEQIRNAHFAVAEARRVHGLACPNGRDYYLQKDGALRLAIEQHRQRAAALAAVEADLEKIGEAISDQMIDK